MNTPKTTYWRNVANAGRGSAMTAVINEACDEVSRLETQVNELREALADIELQIDGFYTATFTNAKSRDENRALKKLLIEQIRAILEKTK